MRAVADASQSDQRVRGVRRRLPVSGELPHNENMQPVSDPLFNPFLFKPKFKARSVIRDILRSQVSRVRHWDALCDAARPTGGREEVREA